MAGINPTWSLPWHSTGAPCDEELIPDDLQMIADAYENDDFWLPPSPVTETTQQVCQEEVQKVAVPMTEHRVRGSLSFPMNLAPIEPAMGSTALPVGNNFQHLPSGIQQHLPNIAHGNTTSLPNIAQGNMSQLHGNFASMRSSAHSDESQWLLSSCEHFSMQHLPADDDIQPLPFPVTVTSKMSPTGGTEEPLWHAKNKTGAHQMDGPTSSLAASQSHDFATSGNGTASQPSHAAVTPLDAKYAESGIRRKKPPKKGEAWPIAPLTAYNFFFRYERNRLLQQDETGSTSSQMGEWYGWILAHPVEFQEMALQEQWGRDRTVKRKHCKSHGRISFQSLAKHISKTWRTTPEIVKDVFEAISARDNDRYEQELKIKSAQSKDKSHMSTQRNL